MSSLGDRVVRFWDTDRGLSVLLGSLVGMIFVVPTLQARTESTVLVVQVFFMLMVVSGVSVAARGRAARLVVVGLFLAAIALYWVNQLLPDAGLGLWSSVARLGAIVLLTGFVLHQAFRAGPITVQRIQGAVAAYLLLGMTWGGVYELIRAVLPDAFRFSMGAPQSRPEMTTTLVYYSFVTLTTMGYGDIIPVHPAARSAAILEALTGQLFPAIFIARLVAMEITSRERAGGPSTPDR